MTKFIIVWILISVCFGVYRYFFSESDKKDFWAAAQKVLLSSGVGLVVIFGLMFLNNFSGL